MLTLNSNSEPPRKFWTEVGVTISKAKEHMQPLLSNWLLTGIEGKFINYGKSYIYTR